MILVTGGTGYIGSHTVVELMQHGFDILIIDNLSNSELAVLDRIAKITGKQPSFEQHDLCNYDGFKHILAKYHNIEGVIHFAALKAVEESVQDPQKYYRNNLLGMIHVLMAQQEFNIPNLVFSSSCTVYGNAEQSPVTEESPILPAWSPYGHTKQICETMIENAVKIHSNQSAIILRYFNPIGAHASANIGEVPVGTPSNLLPYITQTAIGIREQLFVYGNDYSTPDGTCIRDYIHVVDLAKAHVIAMNRLLQKQNNAPTEIFNLGTGIGYTVLDVIHSFEKIAEKKLNYKIVDRRPGDVEKIWANPAKANNILGWKAELSLDDMVLSAWEWEKKYRN